MKKPLIPALTAAALMEIAGTANAHLTAFGWKDNGNFGPHWQSEWWCQNWCFRHGLLFMACISNGRGTLTTKAVIPQVWIP